MDQQQRETEKGSLIELGRRLYDLALVKSSDETITDPRGNPIGWLLDTRIPMLDAACFQDVGKALVARLNAKNVDQVIGFGFGSFAIVCSVLSGSEDGSIQGGFMRERRKPHGRQRLIEGPVDRSKPIVLIDDILNSGRSAIKAIARAEADGFQVNGLMTLFNFTWSGGRQKVEERGIWVDSLLDLNLRNAVVSSSNDSGSDGHSPR
ncbi:MAG: orotate phosphoribosyltransferase [Rhodothermales bacterium]|nr:orotate phosphoribosyltransferase [Rhodothermales bacterium]